MIDLLRRAWDTLDTFKQAYPENWHEQDEQVLKDLVKADLKLSGVKLKWQGLTHKEFREVTEGLEDLEDCWIAIEAKLKEKNA